VEEGTPVGALQNPQPEIVIFSIIPNYTESHRIMSATMPYEVINQGIETTNAKLILKVGYNEQVIDEITLFSETIPTGLTKNGSFDYIPSTEWENGTYTFHTELYSDDILYDSYTEQVLEVNTGKSAVVSWNVLVLMISGMIVVATITVVVVLRRRREIIKSWMEPPNPS
jgi:hypothetical protein